MRKHMLWVLIRIISHGEVIPMSTHNICFYGEISKIIPWLSPNTLLICFIALKKMVCGCHGWVISGADFLSLGIYPLYPCAYSQSDQHLICCLNSIFYRCHIWISKALAKHADLILSLLHASDPSFQTDMSELIAHDVHTLPKMLGRA